jgi:hypothetical protein
MVPLASSEILPSDAKIQAIPRIVTDGLTEQLIANASSSIGERVAPSDERLVYLGRWLQTPTEAKADWSSTTIYLQLAGSGTVRALLSASSAGVRFLAQTFDVDRKLVSQKVIGVAPNLFNSAKEYEIASLPDEGQSSVYIIALIKLSSFSSYPQLPLGLQVSSTTFRGLSIPSGVALLPPPELPSRKIEILASSYATGFGVSGSSSTAGADCYLNWVKYQNSELAFGGVLARRLQAQMHLEAGDGKGVYRNAAGDILNSFFQNPSMTTLFDRTIAIDTKSKWDFSKWVPDVVLVRLGNNDFESSSPSPTVWRDAYMQLLTKIVKAYGSSVAVLGVCGGEIESNFNEQVCRLTEEAIHQWTELHPEDGQPQYVFIPNLDDSLAACMEHPGEDGHKQIANALEPFIRNVTGWHA